MITGDVKEGFPEQKHALDIPRKPASTSSIFFELELNTQKLARTSHRVTYYCQQHIVYYLVHYLRTSY